MTHVNEIEYSIDSGRVCYTSKPDRNEAAKINNRFKATGMEPTIANITQLADIIGRKGCTFCPATFDQDKRCQDGFIQQQFFVLDFDEGITFEEFMNRCQQYHLPVLFVYETFSSVDGNRFRAVFLNDAPIDDQTTAKATLLALATIFPEADDSCYRDVSKMYYGGKGILYQNEDEATINLDLVFRELTVWMLKKHGDRHYKNKLARFAQRAGLALDSKNFLNVCVAENGTDLGGAVCDENGGKLPTPIIFKSNIENGRIPPSQYRVCTQPCTSAPSVPKSAGKTRSETKARKPLRGEVLERVPTKCLLCWEFQSGKRNLNHEELFGLALNLHQIEGGDQWFLDIMRKYPNYYDDVRIADWERQFKVIRGKNYQAQWCHNYCPYRDSCHHNSTMISTIAPRKIELVGNVEHSYCSLEEAHEDVRRVLRDACDSGDQDVHVIRAQTAIGKTEILLDEVLESADMPILIPVTTNVLKHEVYERGRNKHLSIAETPSLDEYRDGIPSDIWYEIARMRRRGEFADIHPFIEATLKRRPITALAEYMEKREDVLQHRGHLVTTHRFYLTMEASAQRHASAIIDEDILRGCIFANQLQLPLDRLEDLVAATGDRRMIEKVRSIQEQSKNRSFVETEGFVWNGKLNETSDKFDFDLHAFCQTTRFLVRKPNDPDDRVKEKLLTFIKPVSLPRGKTIIMSATPSALLYDAYFSDRTVHFRMCQEAALKGTLEEYYGKGMSRASIEADPEIIPRLMKRFNTPPECVITYKKFATSSFYFGNCEGRDSLKGRDLLVIGGAYPPPYLCKLIAFTAGLEFDEEDRMAMRTLTRTGCQYQLMSFESPNLQEIQAWLMESDLEQAVGRARLLRSECTVRLFSNFPLAQATLIPGAPFYR